MDVNDLDSTDLDAGVSTFCGTIRRDELAQHLDDCGACGANDGLRGEIV